MALLPPDPVFCLKSDMGCVHSVCFAPSDSEFTRLLLAATEDGFVHFWDLEMNRQQFKLKVGESVQAVHATRDYIITREKLGTIKFWIRKGDEYVINKTYACSGGFCRTVVENNLLFAPQENSAVEIVDINTLNLIQTLTPDLDKLGVVMCILPIRVADKPYVLVGYESGVVALWDLETAKMNDHLKMRELITSIDYDCMKCRGVCANASNMLQVFVIRDLKIVLKCEIGVTNDGVNVVRLRDDKKTFTAGGWDGRIRIFSWKSLRLLVVLNEHSGGVNDVQYSPLAVKMWKSRVIAAAGTDGMISLWSLYN